MDRLTFDGNFCEISQCEATPGGSFCEDGACSQRKVWERLKEFEDLGYTPAALAKLVKFDEVMKRTGLTVERIYDLIVADEAGRVAILPCKVGDTVWAIPDSKRVCECEVVYIDTDPCNAVVVLGSKFGLKGTLRRHVCSFGNNVFLTREEAEKALEVTRCKDCKWFADNNDGEWYGCKMFHVVRITPEDAPKPDDFCSYGERK